MADENTAGDKPFAEKPTYDQNFFLALAAKGKDAWNEWRRDPANKNVRVTFEGIDFSVAPRDQINFSCFDFGNGADFSDCIWRGFDAIGLEALEIASNPDYFRPGCACFKAATFGFAANFDRVSFGSGASFCGATFDWVASFIGGTFGNDAKFNGATFRPLANFTGTTFGRGTEFYQTHFKGSVDFTGISEEQWTKNFANGFLRSSDASALLKQRHEETPLWLRTWPVHNYFVLECTLRRRS